VGRDFSAGGGPWNRASRDGKVSRKARGMAASRPAGGRGRAQRQRQRAAPPGQGLGAALGKQHGPTGRDLRDDHALGRRQLESRAQLPGRRCVLRRLDDAARQVDQAARRGRRLQHPVGGVAQVEPAAVGPLEAQQTGLLGGLDQLPAGSGARGLRQPDCAGGHEGHRHQHRPAHRRPRASVTGPHHRPRPPSRGLAARDDPHNGLHKPACTTRPLP
jgi:hypothetical protein